MCSFCCVIITTMAGKSMNMLVSASYMHIVLSFYITWTLYLYSKVLSSSFTLRTHLPPLCLLQFSFLSSSAGFEVSFGIRIKWGFKHRREFGHIISYHRALSAWRFFPPIHDIWYPNFMDFYSYEYTWRKNWGREIGIAFPHITWKIIIVNMT